MVQEFLSGPLYLVYHDIESVLGQAGAWWRSISAPSQSASPQRVQIEIPPGTAAQQCKAGSSRADSLNNSLGFVGTLVAVTGLQGEFKSGYPLSPTQSLPREKIWKGEVVQRSFNS